MGNLPFFPQVVIAGFLPSTEVPSFGIIYIACFFSEIWIRNSQDTPEIARKHLETPGNSQETPRINLDDLDDIRQVWTTHQQQHFLKKVNVSYSVNPFFFISCRHHPLFRVKRNETKSRTNLLFQKNTWPLAFVLKFTLPKTNIAPTNGWLEYYFPIGEAYFQGLR